MNNGLKLIFSFAVGAAVGYMAASKLLEKKYGQIAQEEIDSVKERFTIPKNDCDKASDEPTESYEDGEDEEYVPTEEEMLKYVQITKGYSESYDHVYEKKGDSKTTEYPKPYVIPPEEFGEDSEYEQISLTYYADDTLTDEFDECILDWETTVGEDIASHFGEYEDDSVFIKNDRLKCYYEVLKDYRKYKDVVSPKVDE